MTACDFESYYERKHTRASKWLMMLRKNPDVRKVIVPMTTEDMVFMTASGSLTPCCATSPQSCWAIPGFTDFSTEAEHFLHLK